MAGLEGGWTPGERDGRKIPCRAWGRVNMPLEAIARAQESVEPLLFPEKHADRSFTTGRACGSVTTNATRPVVRKEFTGCGFT